MKQESPLKINCLAPIQTSDVYAHFHPGRLSFPALGFRNWRPSGVPTQLEQKVRVDAPGNEEEFEVERKPIRRGGIKSAGYDRNNRVLEIEFDNGSIIQHTAVGEEIARRFIASSSPASVYKDTIQEEFTVKRVK